MMTNEEFDVLDELYFVQPYHHLTQELSMTNEELKPVLQMLLDKGWIKCFYNMNDEVFENELDFENNYEQYFYLASKTGLFAHNQK